jgi:hypothetical protein
MIKINLNEGKKFFIFYFNTKDKVLYFRVHYRLPALRLKW